MGNVIGQYELHSIKLDEEFYEYLLNTAFPEDPTESPAYKYLLNRFKEQNITGTDALGELMDIYDVLKSLHDYIVKRYKYIEHLSRILDKTHECTEKIKPQLHWMYNSIVNELNGITFDLRHNKIIDIHVLYNSFIKGIKSIRLKYLKSDIFNFQSIEKESLEHYIDDLHTMCYAVPHELDELEKHVDDLIDLNTKYVD